MKADRVLETEFVVVGSGPGGACAARELTRSGKKVLILERGRMHRTGTHFNALFYTDRHGFFYTEEGINIVRGLTVGGSSILYCGCCADPPHWLKERYRVDLTSEAEELKKELEVKPLEEKYAGEGSLLIKESAEKAGFKWQFIPKFMNPEKAVNGFHCTSSCMVGCRCGAKWTARQFVDQAIQGGAQLLAGTFVHSLILKEGECVGVYAWKDGEKVEVRAKGVILAAGGIGTAAILQRSHIKAGYSFSIDPTVIVYGVLENGRGNMWDPPMSVGSYEFEEEGFMLAALTDTWLTYPVQISGKSFLNAMKIVFHKRILGIMVKTKDERDGAITIEERVSKPLTKSDVIRMNTGSAIAREILINAGVKPGSIFVSPVRGTHPQGTAAVGEVTESDGRVKGISGCWVADASFIPEALGRPMVLTIMAFAKKVAGLIGS